eukprot:748897-Hanusia_phi.AAC.4
MLNRNEANFARAQRPDGHQTPASSQPLGRSEQGRSYGMSTNASSPNVLPLPSVSSCSQS